MLTQASATSNRHIRSQKTARCSLCDKIFTLHLADSRPLSLDWRWSGVDAITFALQAVAAVLPGPAGAWFGLPGILGHVCARLAVSRFQADIVRVSALALEAQGRLGISQELADSEGTILRQNSAASLETVLHGLSKADGLWLSEDRTHMARLLEPRGQLQVIWQHLRCAQTLITLAPGRYLLAEQGRKCILELKRRPHGI